MRAYYEGAAVTRPAKLLGGGLARGSRPFNDEAYRHPDDAHVNIPLRTATCIAGPPRRAQRPC